MKKLILILFVPLYFFGQNEYVDYRSTTNPLYWKNRKPFEGYWQLNCFSQDGMVRYINNTGQGCELLSTSIQNNFNATGIDLKLINSMGQAVYKSSDGNFSQKTIDISKEPLNVNFADVGETLRIKDENVDKLSNEIENMVRYFLKEQNESSLTLHVHPIVEAYLTKGLLSSIQKKWWMKYKKRVKIKAIASYHFLEYHFFNSQEEEIKV